ncbi:hypothetical protein D9M70_572140 [compost metagenome]
MIKPITQNLKSQLQRHPLLAGLAVAVAVTLLLNLNSLSATATLPLLSLLPCLLMMALCMKGMGGERNCAKEAPDQQALARSQPETKVIDQESLHA